MNYQWYPGHMTRAKRMMQEDIKLIDVIIELADARAPYSSRNPDIGELGRQKARVILLGKADLADEAATRAWMAQMEAQGCLALPLDARKRGDMAELNRLLLEACREKIERDRKRGIKNRPVRAMVAGIPNVGKSTFINTFAGKACTRTGNRPGVTKGKQWIRMNKNVELLDTPGILWPRFEDQTVGRNLALIGSIRDEILNAEELALDLIRILREGYSGLLKKRYGCREEMADAEVLQEIARNRGCLQKGQELDMAKASALLLDDFRNGRIGRITLETVSAEEKAPAEKKAAAEEGPGADS